VVVLDVGALDDWCFTPEFLHCNTITTARGEETRRMLLSAGFGDVWVEDTPAHYMAGGRMLDSAGS
jgi:hypothetical protein